MSGEINGTRVVVLKGGAEIVGQAEATMTFNGAPIEISNKSTQDWVELMDGELSGKQIVISLSNMTYNSDAVFQQVRNDAFNGTHDDYSLTYVSDATTDESFTGRFMPNALSDALPMGAKVATTITLSSSGIVNRIAQS